jgi:hypothetical protein
MFGGTENEYVAGLGATVVVVVCWTAVVGAGAIVVDVVDVVDGAGATTNECGSTIRVVLKAPASPATVFAAKPMTTDVTATGVILGLLESIDAASPDTNGAACDVPFSILVLLGDVCHADVIETPGANTSTHAP